MLPRSLPRENGGEAGTILIMSLVLTLLISIIVASAATMAVQQAKSGRYSLDQTGALAIAEGVTEAAQKQMLNDVANFQPITLSGSIDVGGTSYPYVVNALGTPINRVDTDGVSMVVQPLRIDTSVQSGDGAATIHRVVDLTTTPIFQYMIFYDGDLEVLPGPSMTLGGRVHANGDIYVGCGSTLTVNTDYFRCSGDIYRQRKNDGSTTGGTVNIKRFEQSTYQNMAPGMDSNNSDWLSLALDTWLGTVQSGAHGVTDVAAPNIGTIKAFDPDTGNKGYYHENAGLVIRDGQAYDTDDNPITLPAGTITEHTMYDAREGSYVTLTDIDMGLLGSSGNFPSNGLLYAYRTDATSDQPNGIRLSNGSELARPITVVTEDPLYIQGDYNTVNKKGTAVMADAVNLLSNAWNDSKTPGTLPSATSTQYNLAMITGDTPTPDGGGNYSGGFENLPRFHENWSGRTATIRGAFIKIFESEIANSPWHYGGDVYTAPVRNWQYDTDLLDSSNLPPFTPNAVYFRRVVWDDNVRLPIGP